MRLLRTFAVIAGLALATPLAAQAPSSDPSDMVRGNPKAPVTIIEYASVGCSHCARLHNEVFPAFKKKYIDTGKVRWVAREMITGDPRVAQGGFMLARCAPAGRYFDVTDAIYHDQDKLFANPWPGLVAIAKSVGVTEAQFEACLNDQKVADAMGDRMELAAKDGVNSTPTLMIGGKVVAGGEATLAELDKVVADAMKPAKSASKTPAKKGAAPKAPAKK
jgi:protein-disulfide isomerase